MSARNQRRRRRREEREKRRAQEQQVVRPEPVGSASRIKRVVGLALLVIGTLSSVIGLYWLLQSDISISASEPIDATLPFSTPFEVTNVGYTPIFDLEFSCTFYDVQLEHNVSFSGFGGWKNLDPLIPRLDRNEVASAYCKPQSLVREYVALKVDIGIQVEYRPWYAIWRRSARARFEYSYSGGKGRWIPKAVSEPVPLT